jgi:NADPH:quinone reductase-like Zn-dependent oxidoreductase
MKSLAICGSEMPRLHPGNTSFGELRMEGMPVLCGLVESEPPRFDPGDPAFAAMARVRVRAVSCNYRDKALILKATTRVGEERFWVVGSEFVAEVTDVGPEVTRVAVGDRVVADNRWPDARHTGPKSDLGIPTNHASHEFLVIHQDRLARVPAGMPDEVAATFSLGAQTTYSMVRKLAVGPGSNVLVTSARANTSLFAIDLLRRRGVNVYAATTSMRFAPELRRMGATEVFAVDPHMKSFAAHPEMHAVTQQFGGFDGVLDPFFDLHLQKVMLVTAFGGRYVTCGMYDQYLGITGTEFPAERPNYAKALVFAMMRNIHVIGNCIGTSADLEEALDDYRGGDFRVPVDSVFRGDQVAAFLDRTYNSGDRFGKVVYSYH